MRKLSIFLLIIIIAVGLLACKNDEISVNFYYCSEYPSYYNNELILQSETRTLGTPLSDLESLLSAYLDGPYNVLLRSPFPKGTKLVSVQPGKEMIEVVLSDEFATLEGINLTLACACISNTLLEISNAEMIRIRTESVPLANTEYIDMTQKSLLSFVSS